MPSDRLRTSACLMISFGIGSSVQERLVMCPSVARDMKCHPQLSLDGPRVMQPTVQGLVEFKVAGWTAT